MAINNAALLGLSVVMGAGGTLIYRGLIEDNRSNSGKYIDARIGRRFVTTTEDSKFEERVKEYGKRPELMIPGLGTLPQSSGQAGSAGTGTGQNGSGSTGQSATQANHTPIITKEQLKVKCKSMISEHVRSGFMNVHWLLYRYWCTDEVSNTGNTSNPGGSGSQ